MSFHFFVLESEVTCEYLHFHGAYYPCCGLEYQCIWAVASRSLSLLAQTRESVNAGQKILQEEQCDSSSLLIFSAQKNP